jgi:hypothetical protein
MLLRCFLNDFELAPVASVITGITFAFTFHMRCISIVRSLLLLLLFYFIIITIILVVFFFFFFFFFLFSCHRPFLPGTSLEPAAIPTAQASSFTLQYFPYYV